MSIAVIDKTIEEACRKAEADVIRAKTGGTDPLGYDFANGKGFADKIAAIPSGGAEITDGIVVKARNANGHITEVDYYGDTVYPWTFGAGNENGANNTNYVLRHLQKINFKNTVTKLKNYAMAGCLELASVTGLDWSALTEVGITPVKFSSAWHFDVVYSHSIPISFANSGITSIEANEISQVPNNGFHACTFLKTAKFTKASIIGQYSANCFFGCTALESAEFGSVGHAVVSARPDVFNRCTQSGLTIIVYTTGNNADALLANLRNGATNATIIVKASGDTTYNGVSYSAGDMIIESEGV